MGPKNKVLKLITIERPSKIIPSANRNGYIIPIIAVIPNRTPCNNFPLIDFLLILESTKLDSTLNDTKMDKL